MNAPRKDIHRIEIDDISGIWFSVELRAYVTKGVAELVNRIGMVAELRDILDEHRIPRDDFRVGFENLCSPFEESLVADDEVYGLFFHYWPGDVERPLVVHLSDEVLLVPPNPEIEYLYPTKLDEYTLWAPEHELEELDNVEHAFSVLMEYVRSANASGAGFDQEPSGECFREIFIPTDLESEDSEGYYYLLTHLGPYHLKITFAYEEGEEEEEEEDDDEDRESWMGEGFHDFGTDDWK